jgi:IS30 family transposase
MGSYNQLTEAQRYQIYALKKVGQDQQTIASVLGVSPSTVCREIRRNRGQRGYRAHQAHQKALSRRQHKTYATKMTPSVVARVETLIGQDWSPEQVAGRLHREEGIRISPERIYQHLRADRQAGGTLWPHLRHSGKKRKKRYGKPDGRGQIKNRVSIDARPAIVGEKSRIGDWEIDLVIGARHKGALVTLVERRSRYTLVGKVSSKQAEEVAAKAIELLRPHQAHTFTVTADNGKEFAAHQTIARTLEAAVYFAHPYHSWERGLNENTNGLIRQYAPKGQSLEHLTQQKVDSIQNKLNHRPRKCLNFKTPHEVLERETGGKTFDSTIALTS